MKVSGIAVGRILSRNPLGVRAPANIAAINDACESDGVWRLGGFNARVVHWERILVSIGGFHAKTISNDPRRLQLIFRPRRQLRLNRHRLRLPRIRRMPEFFETRL